MKKESLLYGVVGLLAGAIIAAFSAAYAVNNSHTGMMRMMGMHTTTNGQGMMSNDDMSMSQMTDDLKSKTGDDFDKAFISEMIMHHQGAIDMAKQAKQNAKHDEIKKMADDIISAQSKEISEMKSWQQQWGYDANSTDNSSNNMHQMMQ